MNLTFDEELKRLLDLVAFKGYKRVGQVLYASYADDVLKPECTINEVVWGFCYNPWFAKALIAELKNLIIDYAVVLGRANRTIEDDCVNNTMDEAMAQVLAINGPPLSYSIQTTAGNNYYYDRESDHRIFRAFNATENDGQLWHGLLVPDTKWANGVEEISVTIQSGSTGEVVWQRVFNTSSIKRRTKQLDENVVVFQPFRHPLPLLGLDIEVYTEIQFAPNTQSIDAFQLFGVVSNDFWEWLTKSSFTIKLCSGDKAQVDMAERTIGIIQ